MRTLLRTAVIGIAMLTLLAAACGDSGTTTTAGTEPPPTSSTTVAPTTTAAPPATTVATTSAPTTTAPPATTTSEATTTTAAPTTTVAPTGAVFAIRRVVFGDAGYLEIGNFGDVTGDLDGYWLCQRPSYFALPAQKLEPGESLLVALGAADSVGPATAAAVVGAEGALGGFSPNTGEAALYASSNFSDPEAIRSYVEWGSEGGVARAGRGQVAARAGLWVEGAFVVVPEGATGLTATTPPTDQPGDWIADEGG